MLNYWTQYNISNGIFLCYDQKLKMRMLSSKHGESPREKMKNVFPYRKYEGTTKENFVLLSLFIMFTKTPSSFRGFVSEIANADMKEAMKFKQDILQYDNNIKRDVKYLQDKYMDELTVQKVFREFNAKKIKFYTAWFYLNFCGEDIEALSKSRIIGHTIRKLRFVMLYVTFKDESVNKIKSLMDILEL